jgi:RNA polymerase subunit RPABC4/transcription elongation factor Spt4
MAKTMACLRCQDVVKPKRKDSSARLIGLLLVLVSLFVFWPLAIVGLLLTLFGGTKTACPACSSDQLVPLESTAGQAVMDPQAAKRRLAQHD